jgi:hypothetical protein
MIFLSLSFFFHNKKNIYNFVINNCTNKTIKNPPSSLPPQKKMILTNVESHFNKHSTLFIDPTSASIQNGFYKILSASPMNKYTAHAEFVNDPKNDGKPSICLVYLGTKTKKKVAEQVFYQLTSFCSFILQLFKEKKTNSKIVTWRNTVRNAAHIPEFLLTFMLASMMELDELVVLFNNIDTSLWAPGNDKQLPNVTNTKILGNLATCVPLGELVKRSNASPRTDVLYQNALMETIIVCAVSSTLFANNLCKQTIAAVSVATGQSFAAGMESGFIMQDFKTDKMAKTRERINAFPAIQTAVTSLFLSFSMHNQHADLLMNPPVNAANFQPRLAEFSYLNPHQKKLWFEYCYALLGIVYPTEQDSRMLKLLEIAAAKMQIAITFDKTLPIDTSSNKTLFHDMYSLIYIHQILLPCELKATFGADILIGVFYTDKYTLVIIPTHIISKTTTQTALVHAAFMPKTEDNAPLPIAERLQHKICSSTSKHDVRESAETFLQVLLSATGVSRETAAKIKLRSDDPDVLHHFQWTIPYIMNGLLTNAGPTISSVSTHDYIHALLLLYADVKVIITSAKPIDEVLKLVNTRDLDDEETIKRLKAFDTERRKAFSTHQGSARHEFAVFFAELVAQCVRYEMISTAGAFNALRSFSIHPSHGIPPIGEWVKQVSHLTLNPVCPHLKRNNACGEISRQPIGELSSAHLMERIAGTIDVWCRGINCIATTATPSDVSMDIPVAYVFSNRTVLKTSNCISYLQNTLVNYEYLKNKMMNSTTTTSVPVASSKKTAAPPIDKLDSVPPFSGFDKTQLAIAILHCLSPAHVEQFNAIKPPPLLLNTTAANNNLDDRFDIVNDDDDYDDDDDDDDENDGNENVNYNNDVNDVQHNLDTHLFGREDNNTHHMLMSTNQMMGLNNDQEFEDTIGNSFVDFLI